MPSLHQQYCDLLRYCYIRRPYNERAFGHVVTMTYLIEPYILRLLKDFFHNQSYERILKYIFCPLHCDI